MKGISKGPPAANRNQVRVLLSGPAEEAAGFIRHHAGNADWLKLAEELERTRSAPRDAVLKAICESLTAIPA